MQKSMQNHPFLNHFFLKIQTFFTPHHHKIIPKSKKIPKIPKTTPKLQI